MSAGNTSSASEANHGPASDHEARLRALIRTLQDKLFADDDCFDMIKDIADWGIPEFTAAGRPAMIELRRLLMTRGLYVENHRGRGLDGLAESLIALIGAEEPPEWPPQAIRAFARGAIMQTRNEVIQAMVPERIDPAFRLSDDYAGPDIPIPSADVGTPAPDPDRQPTAPSFRALPTAPSPRTLPPRGPSAPPRTAATQQLFKREETPYPTVPPGAGLSDRMPDWIANYVYPFRGSGLPEKDQMRNMWEARKAFPADSKYTGSTDEMSLEYRAKEFLTFLGEYRISEEYISMAITAMMGPGEVQNHCNAMKAEETDWRMVLARMSYRFEGEAVTRARRNKWHTLSLETIIKEMPDKPLSEVVRAFHYRLSSTQHSLHPADNNRAALFSRLQTGFEQHYRTTRHATTAAMYATEPDQYLRLVYDSVVADERAADLAAAAPTFIQARADHRAAHETLYTDRTFQGGGRGAGVRGPRFNRKQEPVQTSDKPGRPWKCFICGKEDCRWSRHTDAEKAAHKRGWQASNTGTAAQYFTGMVEAEGDWASDQGSDSPSQDSDDGLYTSFWSGLTSGHADAVTELDGRKTAHALSLPVAKVSPADQKPVPFIGLSQYNDDQFMGFIIDTGAARKSTCGVPQLNALKKLRDSVSLDHSTAGAVQVKSGIGTTTSEGSAAIETPIGTVTFHAMPVNTPFLISLADLDRLGAYFEALGMKQSTYDACLMLRNDGIFGLVGLQTDDTLILADDDFAALEASALEKAAFLAKPRETLTPVNPLKFNGAVLQIRTSGALLLSQESQVVNISLISDAPQVNKGTRGRVSEPLGTQQQYVAQRARGAYVASVCQPEAAFDLSSAAQHTEPGKKEIEALNARLQWQIDHPARGLTFVQLDETSVQVVVFTDAAFANNKDLSSQIGYVLTLRDASGKCNIIHWSSTKCRRVTKSVLAAELYALVHGFDAASCVKATMDQIYDRKVPLVICTDSKSVFDAITKLGTTAEKRLMIDVAMLRQSYERREIAEVKWISGESNPADAMTKAKHNDALQRLVDSNFIDLQEEAWVERDPGPA